jgi:hypothetical protein
MLVEEDGGGPVSSQFCHRALGGLGGHLRMKVGDWDGAVLSPISSQDTHEGLAVVAGLERGGGH